MAELPDCKAVRRPASRDALELWHHGKLRCFDNQGGEMGSGPTVDRVVQAVVCRLYCNVLSLKENKMNRGYGMTAMNKKYVYGNRNICSHT